MARFVYLSDTHLGGTQAGFLQQPKYPEQLPALVRHLADWIVADGAIDFVLHGGDLLDATTPANLAAVRDTFALPVPLYLCLGNHDLTTPNALTDWLRAASVCFPDGAPCYTLRRPDCRVHVVPNHWDDLPWFWGGPQRDHFRPEQLAFLRAALAEAPHLPHVLATHAPARPVYPEQTGLPAPIHPSSAEFQAALTQLAADHPHLRLVLSAHNHLNAHRQEQRTHYVSSPSFVETPYEFKVIEVRPGYLRVTTHSLVERVAWRPAYDFARNYVQGRVCDREFLDETP
jgi:3',5'-cyclic AMP phosphodiesterase CpdA